MGEEDYDAAGSSSSLMCQEDLDGIFVDSGAGGELLLVYDDSVEDEEEYMVHLATKESSFCCSPPSSSSSSSDDAESSPSSMAAEDWFRCARRDAVKWILETRAYFGFGHRTAYLAVSYFDRFFLRRFIDRSVMPWATQLLAVACVSLAAKMEEYSAPALSELGAEADADHGFSCVSVRRMELLVLSTLEWRMGDVTPFDYLPCLCSRLRRGHHPDGGGSAGSLVAAKASALIFSAAEAASVLDYRPSTVAVAAVLGASTHGALTKEALESKVTGFSPAFLLEKEDVFACYSMMLRRENSQPPSPPPDNNDRTPVKKRPRPPSCASDDLADAAPFSACNGHHKRMRLEPPGIGR